MKLQIPVSESVASDIASLAEACDRSQTWIARKLLEFSVEIESRYMLGSWMSRRVVGQGTEIRKMEWRQLGGDSAIRLQIVVRRKTADEIEQLGQRLNHTTVRMAALLLDFGLDSFSRGLKIVSWKPFRKAGEFFFGKAVELTEDGVVESLDDVAY